MIGSASATLGAPTTYSFNDAGAGGAAGSGVFTLEIGAPLGDYEATGVAGGGGTLGTWGGVEFSANAGSFSSLVISNLVGASITYSAPGIGGSDIHAGSQADLEWEHFLVELRTSFGIQIDPVAGAALVPESSTWISLAALGLGIAGTQYRRLHPRR